MNIGGRVRGILTIGVPAAGLALALIGAAPAEQAFAQQNQAGTINIGGSIAGTVAGAVAGISSSSDASGGVQSTHSEMSFGEDEGLAISDASGGNTNISATRK